MLSPSPTQQQPNPPETQRKEIRATPLRPRLGQTPLARFIKAILRPPLKAIYYAIQGFRHHFLLSLAIILLLLASISLTSYLTTGQWPLGIGNDPFNFHIRGGDGGGDNVKNWLYALRDGNTTNMGLLQSQLIMSQPPDPTQYVNQFSEPKAHLKWKNITVLSTSTAPDTSLDSFVEVDFSGPGPGGSVNGVMIWHFTTLPSAQGRLLYIDLVSFRPALQ